MKDSCGWKVNEVSLDFSGFLVIRKNTIPSERVREMCVGKIGVV